MYAYIHVRWRKCKVQQIYPCVGIMWWKFYGTATIGVTYVHVDMTSLSSLIDIYYVHIGGCRPGHTRAAARVYAGPTVVHLVL